MAHSAASKKTTTHFDSDSIERKPDPIDIHVGQRLRLRRMLIGMSQEKLGEAVGLTFQQIQKYERGANRMGASRLYRIAQILNIPVSFFYSELSTQNLAGTPGFAETGQAPLQDEVTAIPEDMLRRRETLELVRAYYKTVPKQRRKILDLIKAMALASNLDQAIAEEE
ncbi:MAG: helix-turn-helix transcriptional regulator [Alphaproteobacteria bacterium]